MYYKLAKTITGTNVRKFCDERAMFKNNQKCPVLNIQIKANNNNNYKFENRFMFAMATKRVCVLIQIF